MNNKILVLFFFMLPIICSSQKFDIYLGIDIGIKKDFTTFTVNDNNYFLPPQREYLGRKFLVGDRFFSFMGGIRTKRNFNIELGLSTHEVADYSIFYAPEIDRGSGSSSSSPYLKFHASAGLEVKVFGRFYLVPSIQLSYIRTDLDLDLIVSEGGGMSEFYTRTNQATYFTNNHFLLGFKTDFQWKFNDYLNLNLEFGYHHGLRKSYQSDYQLIFTRNEDEVFEGRAISRLSHTTLSLGLQYKLISKDD